MKSKKMARASLKAKATKASMTTRARVDGRPGKPNNVNWHPKFLRILEATGNVAEACRKLGIAWSTANEHRRKFPEFNQAWIDREQMACSEIYAVLVSHARDGTQRPVFQGGVQVGSLTEFDHRLAEWILQRKRPSEFGAKQTLELSGKASTEIAKAMNVSDPRVSALFQQAREKVRQKLTDLGYSKADVRDLAVRGARPFTHDYDDEPIREMERPEQKRFASDAFGFKAFAKHDVVPTAEAVAHTFRKAGDTILKVFAPTLRSFEAAKAGRSLRAHLAWAAHEHDQTVEAMRDARSLFQGMTAAQNHEFMNAVETDRPIQDPRLAEIYNNMRTLNRYYVDLARSMPGRHFGGLIEHYMPHIWSPDSDTQAAALKYYQGKLEGSRAFMKHRSIPTIQEGLDHGLKLVSDNPVDLFLTRFSQMNRYVVGQRVIDEGKQMDYLRPFDRPEDAPIGWRRIDPRIGLSTEFAPDPAANPELPGMKGSGKQKRVDVHYYAPDEVCQVLENHLSPGLRNSPHEMISTPYKIIMGVANTMNQAQLGMSLFHAGFTTYDTMVSQLALATRQAVPRSAGGLGQPMDALKNVVTLPATPFINYLKGSRLMKEWMAPGTQGDEVNRIMEAAVQGGARAGQDPIYTNGWGSAFHQAWTQGNLPGMTWRAPFAAVETLSHPILGHLVPRQKFGVFMAMMKADMKNMAPTRLPINCDRLRSVIGTASITAWVSSPTTTCFGTKWPRTYR
jgi:hypothetical protein